MIVRESIYVWQKGDQYCFSSGDPVSNALLQHLSAVGSLLEEHNSQASLFSINCYDWSLLCDGYGISTYPVLRLYPHGRRNVTYSNAINYYHILRAILL